jgi:hypothetical protein
VTQKPGQDGNVEGLLAGGGVNGRRRAIAIAFADNSRQHVGGGFLVKRGGKHGERLDGGADIQH